MVTEAVDINTEPWAQTETPAATQTWMSSCPTVAVQATQISMALVSAQTLDTKVATGGGPHPGHLCAFGDNMSHGYQHRPWMSQPQRWP